MSQWTSLWQFSVDPIELIVRGTAVCWFVFALFRFVPRRDAGSVGTADIMLLIRRHASQAIGASR